MSENSSQQAAPSSGAASPRLRDVLAEKLAGYNEIQVVWGDSVDDLADDLIGVWREACTIRTVEQLDALPEGAVVRRFGFTPQVFERASDLWLVPGNDSPDYPGEHMLPALLLWHPDWSDQ